MATARSRKAALQSTARYDAAGVGRRTKGWVTPATGPNRATEGLGKIRDRARDTERNDWAGTSGVQKWTTNLVGVGITPRWEDDTFTKIWNAFVPQADADHVLDAYGLQTLGVRSWMSSGEVFLRRRPRDMNAPLNAPLQVQLIEADFCPLFDTDSYAGLPAGHTIRQGIELNKYGRRTAYWMYRNHPGEKAATTQPNNTELIRIAASEISHVFEPTRPGQLRGVSMMAPILVKLRGSMDFEDAVLERQKLANLFTMFITRAMPPSWEDIEIDPLTGLPKFYDAKGNILAGLEPGTSQELQPGEDVKFANPPESGTSYPDYMRTTHMGTAAGEGLPYELFSGDIRDVSDRTLRIVINEFRRFAKQRQWQIIIPQLCAPMVRWLAEAAVLKRLIRPSQYEAMAAPTWSPEGWEYIHPVQDVEGKIKARDAGLISTSQLISERGDDPRKVLEQIKADKASGLTPEPVAPAAAGAPAAPPAQAAMDPTLAGLIALQTVQMRAPTPTASAEPSALEKTFIGLASLLAGSQAENAVLHKAFADIAQALVNRPLQVEVAAPAVTLGDTVVNVPAGPAPVVNVAAAEVTVPAPIVNNVVNVEPAAVTVELPDRQTTSVIERDMQGNILNVTQTETTLQ
jgi:lambda family phage portal protein